MDLLLKTLGILMAVAGVIIVYGAKHILKKTNLSSKQKINISELDTDKLAELKEYKAIALIKMIGALIFIPGMIIILIAFN